MNWDAISAIGEIVGAVAVIATLLYLAKEIQQNSVSVAISVCETRLRNGIIGVK